MVSKSLQRVYVRESLEKALLVAKGEDSFEGATQSGCKLCKAFRDVETSSCSGCPINDCHGYFDYYKHTSYKMGILWDKIGKLEQWLEDNPREPVKRDITKLCVLTTRWGCVSYEYKEEGHLVWTIANVTSDGWQIADGLPRRFDIETREGSCGEEITIYEEK